MKPLSSLLFYCLLVGAILLPAAQAKGTTEKVGDVLEFLLPATALGTTLVYEDGYEGTLQFSEAFVTSELTTEALKHLVDKERPNGNCCDSFPSGHTSTAFTAASFIHMRYGWKYAVPAYVAATYVGYSRVEADKHYVEDVVAGAAIGVLSSYLFTTPYHGVTIIPTASSDFVGVNVSAKW